MLCPLCTEEDRKKPVRLVAVTLPETPPTEFTDDEGAFHSHHHAPVRLEWQCAFGDGWIEDHTPYCTVPGCERSTEIGAYAD